MMTANLVIALTMFHADIKADHMLSCEEIAKAGRAFVRENGLRGNPVLISTGGYSINNGPIDGWHLRFLRNGTDSFDMKMDDYGNVDWLEKNGGGSVKETGLPADWRHQAIQKALAVLNRVGIKEQIKIPDEKSVSLNWFVYFPILVDGKPFFGSKVGYSVRFIGADYDLTHYKKDNFIPAINAKVPAVTAAQALAEANRVYPSDPDFDGRSGTHKYTFPSPSLGYYWSGKKEDEAKLAWYFDGESSRNTGYAIQGGSFRTAVNALTGKVMDLKR